MNYTDSITLLDGRIFYCYPRQERMQTRWPLSQEARSENKRLFAANVHRFICHADAILSDSRLFLSPVGFYTSIGPTAMPCLGAFIEWWLNCEEYSHDEAGNPIYSISGNPMTGSSGCGSVDAAGNLHSARLRHRFIETVKSFNRIANRYRRAAEECEAYTLEQVLAQLPPKQEPPNAST